ncbi:MAG: adenosine deaminase [bacterium]
MTDVRGRSDREDAELHGQGESGESRVPLVELHTHLEGSLTPARFVALADRHGRSDLVPGCLDPAGEAFSFSGFHGFLDLYRRITSVMRTPADFHGVALDLGEQLDADGVVYAEVSVSYGVLLKRGIDPAAVQEALAEAAAQVRQERGVAMAWLPDAVRQWGPTAGMKAWEAAGRCGRRLGVVGFGLGGDENAGPAAGFAALFAEVRREGLGVSIHAGEIPAMGPGGIDSVRQAVEDCGAHRIGHGLAAGADPPTLALLAERGICVEMCPGSNVKTGGIAALEEHPLRRFLDAGVSCCLNTDDRTLFGLDLRGEYAAAESRLGLTPAERSVMMDQARRTAFGVVPGGA